jgi:hypothetical protein
VATGDDAAVLRALRAQDAGQLAGVDAGDGDGAFARQVGVSDVEARKLERRSGRSLMIRPAAWIFDASTSSSLMP